MSDTTKTDLLLTQLKIAERLLLSLLVPVPKVEQEQQNLDTKPETAP